MVMIFSDPHARAQLLNVGLVDTVRKKRRKKVGKDWARAREDPAHDYSILVL